MCDRQTSNKQSVNQRADGYSRSFNDKSMTDLMSEIKAIREESSIITVMGVGGAGSNAVNHMWNLGIKGVTFMVCNTDRQALNISPVERKIQLGEEGLGAGSDPSEGRKLAMESIESIRQALLETKTKMVFITAGMGGGTGTGASPVIAQLAKEMNLLTVAIVTSPLQVEGKPRYDQAQRGIEELREIVDSLLIINNENILELYGRLSLKQAFGKADDVLALATKGIAEIITVESDLVNVDFADVSRVMRNSGRAHMAVAVAAGEDRALAVAKESLQSPLLDHYQITGAKQILLNISVDQADNLIYEEVHQILDFIQAHATVKRADGTVQTANLIWGTSEKPELGDQLELVLVATGFDEENQRAAAAVVKEPVKPEVVVKPASGLDEFKPAPRPQVQEPVVLGAPSRRYGNMNDVKAEPAYKARKATFVVSDSSSRKEVLRSEEPQSADKREEKSGSLFE